MSSLSKILSYAFSKPKTRTIAQTENSRIPSTLPYYAGHIYYRSKNRAISKSYILLFSWSVSRAIHLKLVSNLTTQEFIKSMKRLIAGRGRPKIVYSDNMKALQAGAKWLTKINKEEKFHKFLSNESITRKSNLSQAPWWGGQFE